MQVNPSSRSTTQTEVTYSERPPFPLPPARPDPGGDFGPPTGRPLGNEPHILHPLSRAREAEVHATLHAIEIEGGFDRLQGVEDWVRGLELPQEIQTEFERWVKLFHGLRPGDEEGLTFAVGIFLFQVFVPLSKILPEDIRNEWIRELGEILRQILPRKKSIEQFLKECMPGILKWLRFREQSTYAELAIEVQNATIEQTLQEEQEQISEIFETLKSLFLQFQQATEERFQALEEQLSPIAQQVNNEMKKLQQLSLQAKRLGEKLKEKI